MRFSLYASSRCKDGEHSRLLSTRMTRCFRRCGLSHWLPAASVFGFFFNGDFFFHSSRQPTKEHQFASPPFPSLSCSGPWIQPQTPLINTPPFHSCSEPCGALFTCSSFDGLSVLSHILRTTPAFMGTPMSTQCVIVDPMLGT